MAEKDLATTARLVERSDAIDRLGDVLRDTRRGCGRALFVIGEAGLGKTTVLRAACDLAEADGFTVRRSGGDAMETSLPFGVAAELFPAIAASDPVLGRLTGEAASGDSRVSQLYGALRSLQRSDAGPLLLAVDDLHWADADSLALLSFLCRRLGSLNVALVGTMRPWPRAGEEAASALAYDGHASIVRLAALTEAAAGRLLADRAGWDRAEADVRAAWASCAGNPLLLEQVALAWGR